MSIKFSIKIVWVCLFLTILAIIGVLIYQYTGIKNVTMESIRDYIASLGAFGPWMFMLISFLQVTIVPIPSNVVIIAGSMFFGPWLTFFYSFIGIMIGSLFAFYLGRQLGRPFVNWLAGDKEKVENYLERLKGKERILFFLMFLFPVFPDDLLCSIAGITPLKWREFTIMQVLTRPIAIGGTLLFFSGSIIPYNGWGLLVIGVLAVLMVLAFVFAMKYSNQINQKIDQWAIKLFNKKNK